MKKIYLLLSLALVAFMGCRSIEITNFDVLSNKDGKVVYRVDAVENTTFSSRPLLGIICASDSKGDLVCR
ncbi:MAG TPA: hypothetical protein PLY93_12450 [Turneriella sp.]|nr:hypothetical protein [Turneriella sp.]